MNDVIEATQEDDSFDWFTAFANRKTMNYQKIITETIIENNRYVNSQKKGDSKAETASFLLHNKNNKELGKMTDADMKYYKEQVNELTKRENDDFFEI